MIRDRFRRMCRLSTATRPQQEDITKKESTPAACNEASPARRLHQYYLNLDRTHEPHEARFEDVAEASYRNPLYDTAHPAVRKVFATYELVEQILLQLKNLALPEFPDFVPRDSIRTLLLAQKINKTFCHVIRRSQELQVALFFKPGSLFADEPDSVHEGPHRCWNPLLAACEDEANEEDGRVSIHLTYGDRCQVFIAPSDNSVQQTGTDEVEESWRRMLICQVPRPYNIDARMRANSSLRCMQIDHTGGSIRLDSKCTMGELWEKLSETDRRWWRSKYGR